jgi:serine/threonine protein kinase
MSFLYVQIQVAIKCLSRERMQNNPIEFLKEAAIMHAIDHEHIVRLYGVVLDTNALMLVRKILPSLILCSYYAKHSIHFLIAVTGITVTVVIKVYQLWSKYKLEMVFSAN